MDNPKLNILSLFSGFSGLDLGVSIAAPGSRVLAYVEWEAYAASVLMARMEEASLGPAPIFCGDIQSFDGIPWRGKVDCITAGFPCQDISTAGKGEGIVEGNRSGLWFEVLRIVREVRPRFVFLENVSAILVRGLDTVLGGLAEAGYDAEWMCLRASDVGASHRRERWFCLAYAKDANWRPEPQRARRDGAGPASFGNEVADSDRFQPSTDEGRPDTGTDRRNDTSGRGAELARTGQSGREGGEQRDPLHGNGNGPKAHGPAAELHGLFPPGPSDFELWGRILRDHPGLAPAVESPVRGMADGAAPWSLYRQDRLRLLGNGVVPLQSAVAFVHLWNRMGGT